MNPTEPEYQMETPPVNEPDDFKAMAIGATLVFVWSLIPFANLLGICCLPQILGVFLAIHLFTKEYRLTLSYGQGIKLGIFTVGMGAVAAWLVGLGVMMLTGYQVGHEIQDMMLKYFDNAGPNFAQAAQQMHEQIDKQRADGVTLKLVMMGAAGTAIGACIGGLIGGALGTAIFKRGPKAE